MQVFSGKLHQVRIVPWEIVLGGNCPGAVVLIGNYPEAIIPGGNYLVNKNWKPENCPCRLCKGYIN